MNEATIVEESAAMKMPLAALRKNWGWMLGIGIVLVVLGMIGLGMPLVLTEVSMLYLGILLLIGGVAQLVHAFATKAWKDVLLHVVLGILYLIAGAATIQNPQAMSMILTLFLAGVLIAVGLVRIVIGLQLRKTGSWFWPVLSGIIAIVLGGMIMAQWPISGLWVIGMFIGIELLLNGWTCIMVAFALKSVPAGQ
jgi:uncharacterized membrane protein HdeD (DUF308 family)